MRRIQPRTIMYCIVMSFFLYGCVLGSSGSIYQSESRISPGLPYFLPQSTATITVTPYGVPGYKKDEEIKELIRRDFASDEIFSLKFSISPSIVPDPGAQYVLRYNANAHYTDRICAGTEDGLLLAVEASSADETGNAVISIAKAVSRLLGPSPFALEKIPGTSGLLEAQDIADRKLAITIDPLNPDALAMVESAIKKTFREAKGPASSKRFRISIPGVENLAGPQFTSDCPPNSVCYRTKQTLPFIVRDADGTVVYADSVEIVDRSVTGHVDISRAFLVEKVTRLRFDSGVLTSVAIRKPSESLAAARLPLAVIDGVMTSLLAAPGRFVSNLSGLPPATQIDLIKQATANAVEVAKLEQELQKLRNADFLVEAGGRTEENTELFKIQCTGTSIAPGGQ